MFATFSASIRTHRSFGLSSRSYSSAGLMLALVLAIPAAARADGIVATSSLNVDANSAVTGIFQPVAVSPRINESSAGEWVDGTTITLSAPVHFAFDTSAPSIAAVVSVGDLTLEAAPVFSNANQVQFRVAAAGASTAASTVRFDSIRLRAVDCTGGTAGPASDVTVTVQIFGDVPPPDNFLGTAQTIVDVTVMAGQAGAPNMGLDHFDVTANMPTQAAGSNILFTVTARDLCNNAIPNFTPASDITLSASGGTAGSRTFTQVIGSLVLVTAPDSATTSTAFDGAGQGVFNVSSSLGEDPAITITATLGAATGNVAVHWITATCTGVAPAAETNLVGTNHTVTATIQRNGVNVVDGTVVNFTIAGINAGGPFARLTAGGVATFTYTSNGTIGFDTITAAGSVDGVPYTTACLGASKEWITSACSLAPFTDSNAVGTPHTATVTVLRNGLPTNGINVTFSILAGSPNDAEPDQVIATAGVGTADFTYTSNGTPGIDTIQATGIIDTVPFTCTATKTWINAQCLLLPSADINAINTDHTVTVTVSRDGSPVPAGQAVSFEITAGPNAPFGPVAGLTDVFGQSQFTYTGIGGTGPDTIRSFGTINGVSFQCFATKTWVDAQCSIAPPTETNQIGTNHTVDVTVLRNGVPVPDGTVVNFDILPGSPNVSGPFPRLVAGGAGVASFTYTGGLTPGTDTIRASGTTVDGVPFICTATKTWINVACSLTTNPASAIQLVGQPIDAISLVSQNGVPVAAGQFVDFELLPGSANFGSIAPANNIPTIAGGTATFTYTGTAAGIDTVRASETISGVLFECTKTIEWVSPTCSIPASLGPKPRNANHTVTTTVLRRPGAPANPLNVTIMVLSGPNAGVSSGPIPTNAAGEASFTYAGTGVPTAPPPASNDTDTIQASSTVEGQLVTCTTTQQWIESGCALDLIAPPTVTSQVGTQQTVQVTVLQNGAPPNPGVNVTFAIAGVNAAVIPDTPAVASTNGSGQAVFSYTSNGIPGSDTITASGTLTGGVPFNCAVNKTWVNAQCNLTPLTSTNQIGTQHTVTGTVRLNGIPQAGVPVTFDVTVGPNAAAVGPTVVPTDVNGEASFPYTSNGVTGVDTITATGTAGGVPFTATANKTWVDVSCSLDPAADTNPVGTVHAVEVTLLQNGALVNGNTVTFAVISGPNFGVAGVVSGATGTTGAGQATFTYTSGGNTGVDIIQASGSVDGVPFSCTASKTWITVSCNVTPPTQQAPVNANATVTATVLRNGIPAAGVPITFQVTGANSAGPTAVPTNASGQAVFTYPGGPNTGTDNIAVTGSVDGVPLTCNNATVQRVTTGCTLTPPTEVNQLGTNRTVTVEVLQNGAPVAGILVGFEVIVGPNIGDTGFGFTNALGRAPFTYTGDGGLGTDTIRSNGTVGGLPFECMATKEWINAACNIAPAAQTNQISTTHTATVTVTRNGVGAPGVDVVFDIIAGPNVGLVAPRTTGPGGVASLLYTSNGVAGTDTIQVTGNVDGVVPILCTATKTWINATCSLAPASDTNPVDTAHSVTVTVTRNGGPAAGVSVTWNILSGPNAGLALANGTNGAGQAVFTYTGAGGVGTDAVRASGVVDGVPFLCTATKTWQAADNSGIDPNVENGAPNNGDGNGDGIPDSLQPNVASLPDINGNYATLVSPPGTQLVDVKAIGAPSSGIPPPGVVFPVGFFSFRVEGLPPGAAAVVTIILHSNPTVNSYYKFGPTPIIPVDHFYSFLFDGTTGAEISGNVVTLHLVDGQRGDGDLAANGVIVEPGAPSLQSDNPAPITPPAGASCGLCGAVSAMTMMVTVLGLACMKFGRGGRRRGSPWRMRRRR